MCSTLRLTKKKWYERGKNVDEFGLRVPRIKSRKIKTCCDWMVCAMKSTKLFVRYFVFARLIIAISDGRRKEKPEKKKSKFFSRGKRNVIFVICVIVIRFFFFIAIRRNARTNASDRNSSVFPKSKKMIIYTYICIYT